MTEAVDAKSTYGKGLLGRVRNVLQANILPLVGGEFDGRVATFEQFTPFLPPCPFPPRSLAVEAANLNVRLPKVLDTMFLSGNRRLKGEAYIEAIGGFDFGNISKIAMRTAVLEPQNPKTAIRVVFGGTNQMPLRGLSGFLPALIYMESLKEAGITVPQLQLIFADNISSSANNHIPFEQAVLQSDRFADLATNFVRRFFPPLEDFVVMLRDTPVGRGTLLGDKLSEIAAITSQVISEETRQALVGKGDNGNGKTNIYYGAAHLLVHDIALAVFVPVVQDQIKMLEPEAIISIGGRQEHFFYRFRHEVKPYLPEEYQQVITFQFFTRHQVPPYYMAKDGDLSLHSALNSQLCEYGSVSQAARYDLDYLNRFLCSRGEDLQSFLDKAEVES